MLLMGRDLYAVHSDLFQVVSSGGGAHFLGEENGTITHCFLTDKQNSVFGLGFSQELLYIHVVVHVSSVCRIQAGAQQTIRKKSCSVFLPQALRKEKEGIKALAYPGKFITYKTKSLNFGT